MHKALLFAVSAACAMACGGPSEGSTPPSNADLRRAVEGALASEAMLSMAAKNVAVTIAGGVLLLRGSVETDADRLRIEAVARATPGVVGCADDLEISSTRDQDDAESDRRIADALDDQVDAVHAGSVRVTSQHGLVTLAGRVSTEDEAARIIEVANTMPGVAAVDDELESP
jgi:osmotically-inducible protein OsmY